MNHFVYPLNAYFGQALARDNNRCVVTGRYDSAIPMAQLLKADKLKSEIESAEYTAIRARNTALLAPNDKLARIATRLEEGVAEARSTYSTILPTLPSNKLAL